MMSLLSRMSRRADTFTRRLPRFQLNPKEAIPAIPPMKPMVAAATAAASLISAECIGCY
jgi:hypothetical protein